MTEKKKMGAPTKDIDWDEIDKLARIHCTETEICDFVDRGKSFLQNRCKERFNCTFKQYLEQKRGAGKRQLRKVQFDMAVEDKCVPMAIFLGKNLLGQSDKIEQKNQHAVSDNVKIVFESNGREVKKDGSDD